MMTERDTRRCNWSSSAQYAVPAHLVSALDGPNSELSTPACSRKRWGFRMSRRRRSECSACHLHSDRHHLFALSGTRTSAAPVCTGPQPHLRGRDAQMLRIAPSISPAHVHTGRSAFQLCTHERTHADATLLSSRLYCMRVSMRMTCMCMGASLATRSSSV